MPCTPIRGSYNGKPFFGFLCSRGRPKAKPCAVCGAPSSKLCDGDIGNGKTCDLPLCERCAIHVEPNGAVAKPIARSFAARPPPWPPGTTWSKGAS